VCCSVKRDAMSVDQPVVSYSAGKGRLSYINIVDRMHNTRASHPYRRPSLGTTIGEFNVDSKAEYSALSSYYDRRAGRATPVLCPASVSDLYIARSLPGERVRVMSVSERLC